MKKLKNILFCGGGGTHLIAPDKGFTLAEVLITLSIIGVVAALTIPNLIANHNKSVVEQKLKKFYSMINQAIILAEAEHGDRKFWYQDINSVDRDEDGNIIPGSSAVVKWWNKYLAPYIKTVDIKEDNRGLPTFYFEDGSALKAVQDNFMRDWVFYTMNPEKCEKLSGSGRGICSFYFIYMPLGKNDATWEYHYNKGFEPFKYNWDGSLEYLKANCQEGSRLYCTALIQRNGWEIPEDYSFRVKY